ncbi:MAG: heme ABC exporter ATP-binding protein CcmA [Gammaproteobacteria bacterium]|nr:heme ABC exporter ATP-binding protein CcmA [Gammaproteobacteria bacterium]
MTLTAEGIHVWRGSRHVLRGLSFAVAAGEAVHVAGPNGTGKTTLLRVLAGLLAPEQGSVRWGGRAIVEDRDAYSGSLSYLGHDNALKADLSALENLEFATGLRRELQAGEAGAALERVGIARCADLPARALSAGQRRRLALARVVLALTPLWLLDEPFTNLDADGTALLAGVVAGHVAAGGLVLLAAHQLPELPVRSLRRLELA